MVDVTNETQHKATPPPAGYYFVQAQEDEISLLDICRVLVRQRKWIFAIALIVSLVATGYALLAPKVYKIEAIISPPNSRDIEGLNIPSLDYEITADKVFEEMVQNLKNQSLQQQFFNNNKQITGTLNVEDLNKKRGASEGVSVSMKGGDPKMLANSVNDFVTFVNDYTVRSFLDFIKREIENSKNDIQDKLESLKKQAKQQRLDRIVVLAEALRIAQKLGINDIVVAANDTPLYKRGTNALSAEIEALQNRKDDAPFIEGLRDMQAKLDELDRIKLDTSAIQAARIDQRALSSPNPIKPKRKRIIIVLGVMLGLLLGIFAAFVVNFVENAGRREN